MTGEVVVVGGGVMGSSAAWHLAARGRRVTLLERFAPGHDRGSSHGSSRIFRLAYPEPEYVALAVRALPLWRRLEEETGTALLELTGAVDHGPAAATSALHAALATAGRPAELLDPARVAERWPGLRADTSALFHPEAGRLHADHAVAAFQRAAAAHGAEVRHGVRIARIAVRGGGNGDGSGGGGNGGAGVELVTTEEEVILAEQVVVAVGGWAPGLLSGLVPGLPPMRVTEERPVHFPAAAPLDWPSFIHHGGAQLVSDVGVYGLGSVDGVKVGFHGVGPVVDPDHRAGDPDPRAVERVREYARRWLPGVDHTAPTATTCLYTTTPDHDFVVDRRGPVTVLAGFSGHGFKFASVLGALAADLVEGRPAARRFALGAGRGR